MRPEITNSALEKVSSGDGVIIFTGEAQQAIAKELLALRLQVQRLDTEIGEWQACKRAPTEYQTLQLANGQVYGPESLISRLSKMLGELDEWRTGKLKHMTNTQRAELERAKNLTEVLTGLGWRPPS